MFEIVAAIGQKGELGFKGKLIWRIPEDMERFKKLTMGHTVLMGRKTFESLPNGALKGRKNIVVTSDPYFKARDVTVVSNLHHYLKKNAKSDECIFVIGGEMIYEQTIQYVDTIHMTEIADTCEEADTFFPIHKLLADFTGFVVCGATYDGISYSFVTYKRKNSK